MEKQTLDWKLGYMRSAAELPDEWMVAQVPGAVQLDYAAAHNWEPWYMRDNYHDYAWMEDVYWLYRAPLNFQLADDQCAAMVFKAIDYRYKIRVDGDVLYDGEGMFSEVRLDVSKYAGKDTFVEVLIWPVPKSDDSNTRDQANHSCKAAACYGWDWHPRLVTSGIWDEAYLEISQRSAVKKLEVSYRLNESLDLCTVRVEASTDADSTVRLQILDGNCIVSEQTADTEACKCVFNIEIKNPRLWYPVGYGEQAMYTFAAHSGNHTKYRKVGFRRAKMVMNEGSWAVVGYPKTRADAPATLEVNGTRVFAKGSNWVNATVFPGEMNDIHYRSLLQQAVDANMNIMRVWGGGFVNKESFFDICDELGIMVWQEFPLACNEYPDEDHYLSILCKEATSIVRRLRTHPCVVLWCGGNELFNSWSGMTEQHHALRLLDRICYEEDRFTPFIMTSPLNGMAHGPYRNYDEGLKEELITSVRKHHDTAYTEFGAPAMSSKNVLLSFMSEDDCLDCNENNPSWVAHFGFKAGWYESWIRFVEVNHYFGGYSDMDDLIRKTQFIQATSYRSVFEEARCQWPHCSMVVNWCWNEPWPCAANCSVIAFPDVPKPALDAIGKALRPQASALRVDKHLWKAGETFTAEVWMLNDSGNILPGGSVSLQYNFNGQWTEWGTLKFGDIAPRTNLRCGIVSVQLPADCDGMIRFRLTAAGQNQMNSEYTYICQCKTVKRTKALNVDW